MEFNWDNIRKLLQGDHDQPLPPELDWSQMEDGIFDKIKSIQQDQPSRRNGRKRLGLLLLLLLVGSCGLFRISQNWTKERDPGTSDVVLLPEAELSKTLPENNTMQTPSDPIEHADEILAGESREDEVLRLIPTYEELGSGQGLNQSGGAASAVNGSGIDEQPGQKSLTNEQVRSQKNLLRLENDLPVANNGLEQNSLIISATDPDQMHSVQSVPDPAQSLLTLAAEKELNSLSRQVAELQPLPAYPLVEIPVEARNISIPDNWRLDSVDILTINDPDYADQFVLEGGVTFWNQGYSSNKPERAQYETPLASLQVQGYYMKRFKGTYFVMGGLQYQQLESKFEFSETIDDYIVTLTDTIIQVQNNLLSGGHTIIRGDVDQVVQAERRIRHYNRTQLFKVSVGIGKSWRFQAFQVDGYLGGALNSLVHNQGRTYDAMGIIDYNGVSNSVFQNRWTVDGVVGVRLQYLISQTIGLTSGFQVQKSLMNWSAQDQVKMYPVTFGVQLGLSYSFH